MTLYKCEKCNYASKYKTHYTDHLQTKKHIKNITGDDKNTKSAKSDFTTLKPDFDTAKPDFTTLKPDFSIFTPDFETATVKDDTLTSVTEHKKLECEYCYLIINNNSNYHKHINRCIMKQNLDKLKHLSNQEIKYIYIELKCPLCKMKCSRPSSLNIHIKNCKIKIKKKQEVKIQSNNDLANNDLVIKQLQEENKKLKDDIKIIELNEKLKYYEKIHEVYKENNKLSMANSCNVNGLIQTNMRSITFLEKFMNNAPELKSFIDEYKDPYSFFIDYSEQDKNKESDINEINTINNILYFDESKMSKDEYLIDHILFLQKTKRTVNFIADRLIYFYKRENEPVKQSIWNVDMYRYNFTISLKSGDKTIWHSDKQGQLTSDIIITPLLEFICNILQTHIVKLKEKITELTKELNTSEIIIVAKKLELLSEFIISVKNNELQQEIIKRISPVFSFDIKKHTNLISNNP
jgi:hypothetical protein